MSKVLAGLTFLQLVLIITVARTIRHHQKITSIIFLYLGVITNPKNGRVKALSEACLDRTYLDVDPFSKK